MTKRFIRSHGSKRRESIENICICDEGEEAYKRCPVHYRNQVRPRSEPSASTSRVDSMGGAQPSPLAQNIVRDHETDVDHEESMLHGYGINVFLAMKDAVGDGQQPIHAGFIPTKHLYEAAAEALQEPRVRPPHDQGRSLPHITSNTDEPNGTVHPLGQYVEEVLDKQHEHGKTKRDLKGGNVIEGHVRMSGASDIALLAILLITFGKISLAGACR